MYPKNRKSSPLSKTHKENLRKSLKGRVTCSPEAIKRMANTKRGRSAPWMVGNKFNSGDKNSWFGKFGQDHPCWKDVKTRPFHKQIRSTFQYRQWRSDVFTRDSFTCVLCGVTGCYIEADHYPKMFIEIINEHKIKTLDEAINCAELWNINNGRTLCKPCHDPTRGKRNRNIKK